MYFRGSCSAEAERRGLSGFVRNLDDGRVEAVFEGSTAAVEELVAWCRAGPQGAHVSGLELFEDEPVGESGFRVL